MKKLLLSSALILTVGLGVAQAQTVSVQMNQDNRGPITYDTSTRTLTLPGALVMGTSNVAGTLTSTYTSTSATPGTVRDIYGKAVVGSGLTMTSGNLVGVRGEVNVPSGTTASTTAFLYGAQGKFVGGGTLVSPVNVAGVLGQLDVSVGTYTSGVISAGWFDMGATASASAISTGLGTAQIIRLTNTTAAVIPQAIYIEAYATNMLEVHSTGEGEAWHSATCTPGSVTGATGGLRITIDGVTKWIPLAATCS